MTNPWPRLGAFVGDTGALGDDKLAEFAAAGGAWIVPVLLGDQSTGPSNLAQLDDLKARAAAHGVKTGAWMNYWGEDPASWAASVAQVVHEHNIGPVILDCESSVQGSTAMSHVAVEIRTRLSGRQLGVSTNSLNDAVVYNGRIEGLPEAQWQSFRKLGIRVLPQWCYGPAYTGPWVDPVENMTWLAAHGAEDNLHDGHYRDGRAVTAAMVHPTVEPTGVENADLATGLEKLHAAQAFGFTKGLSLYLLERTPSSDLTLVARYRGLLYT